MIRKKKYKQEQACGYYDKHRKKTIRVCNNNCNECKQLYHKISYEDFLIYYNEDGKLIK